MTDGLPSTGVHGTIRCLAAVALFTAAPTGSAIGQPTEAPSRSHGGGAETESACTIAGGYRAEGTASWYGSELDGRTTASGETFDKGALTAAHPSLPLGSRIRVTNMRNGRSVVVTVNDRGPFADDRLLDLSQRAARELDFLHKGLTPVRIEETGDC